jgi:hypothetical protein
MRAKYSKLRETPHKLFGIGCGGPVSRGRESRGSRIERPLSAAAEPDPCTVRLPV